MSALPAPAPAQLLPLRMEHLEAVLRVEQSAYPHPWTRGNFVDALQSGYEIQRLVQGDELLGYFVAMSGVHEVHLLNITVAPAWQRQGWARLMLETLKNWAQAQGAHTLWLEVRLGNTRAQAVYTRHGFQRVGVRKAYYPAARGQREDAVVMSLRL